MGVKEKSALFFAKKKITNSISKNPSFQGRLRMSRYRRSTVCTGHKKTM
jgi:hypothetical protein